MPKDTKHQVGGFVKESLSVNSDNFDHCFGDSEGLIEVFTNLIDIDIGASVDGTHIDSVFLDVVNQVDEDHTVRACMEEVFVVRIDGKSLLDKCVLGALSVDSTCNHTDFFAKVVVVTTRLSCNLSSSLASFCGKGSTKILLSRRFDHLHHIEELDPFNDTVSVFVDTGEHLLDLLISDITVTHAIEHSLELTSINRAIGVLIIGLESSDHLRDLLRVEVLSVGERHLVLFSSCWVSFDHLVFV